MYQLAVETLGSPVTGLNDLPVAEATATANSDIALFSIQSVYLHGDSLRPLVGQRTPEERILAQQERKAALGNGLYSAAVGRKQPLFSESDLVELLKLLSV